MPMTTCLRGFRGRAIGLASAGLAVAPAFAHGPAPHHPAELARAWELDPLVLAPLLAASVLYGIGLFRLWKGAGRGRGVTGWQALSFAFGILVLVGALVSPLDPLGSSLLSAHMAQHGLLAAVAPPLLMHGKPGVVFAWALAVRWRKPLFGSAGWHRLAGALGALARPSPAMVAHGLALWLWHAPFLYEAALENYAVHAAEHFSMCGPGLRFGHARGGTRARRRAAGARGAAFTTMMHCGLLGALITMAPLPLYPWYAGHGNPWGISVMDDQQFAGLLMWVPMGMVYFAGCVLLAQRMIVPGAGRTFTGSVPACQESPARE